MGTNEKKIKLNLRVEGREALSMQEFLQKVEQLNDKEMEEQFKLMPHQVMDIKDALRRSKF